MIGRFYKNAEFDWPKMVIDYFLCFGVTFQGNVVHDALRGTQASAETPPFLNYVTNCSCVGSLFHPIGA